jgi:hypothetical protein
MQIHVTEERIDYDGSQLSSHFALQRFGVRGDAMVVFKGAMDIRPEKIADLEDRLQGAAIRSKDMLHFIVELFGCRLECAILKQRLLVRLAAEILAEEGVSRVRVDGDDLYVGEGKLSVSIAAPSPVSCLIHLGLNIETEGVPVKAAGLKQLGMDPDRLAADLAKTFVRELEGVAWAGHKVRGVP